MDGVITSEYTYWDSAALTVYQLLYDYRYYGKSEIDRAWCRKNCKEIYNTIFCGGKTVRAVKSLGVNTNWDLAYIVFCVSKYLSPELTEFDPWHFQSVCMFIENITANAPEVYDLIAGLVKSAGAVPGDCKRSSDGLWSNLVGCFQKWYLGDENLPGLNRSEAPLIPLEKIKQTLSALKNKGIRLGIGTGRPRAEIIFPLENWGILQYFESEMIATYDDILNAEKLLDPEVTLSKPHPFVFLKAAFSAELSDKELTENDLKEKCKDIAVIGDAPSDLLAAKAADMCFAGVLTGIDRASAEEYFSAHGADYILNDMSELA